MSLEQSTQQQQLRQSYCVSSNQLEDVQNILGQNQECNKLIADKRRIKPQSAAYLHDSVKDVFIAMKSILQIKINCKRNCGKEIAQDNSTTDKAKKRAQSLRKNIAMKLPKIKDIIEEMNDHQIEKVYREHIGGKESRHKFKGFQSKPIISFPLHTDTKKLAAKQISQQIQEQKEQLTGQFKIKRTQTGIIKAFLPQHKQQQQFLKAALNDDV